MTIVNNILWCPIDLPKCPVIPTLDTSTKWHFWEFAKLTINDSNPYAISEFTAEIKHDYPELIEWFNLFPYKNIRNIKLNHQLSAVSKHIDFTRPELDMELYKNNQENEPCGYRILLKGTRNNKLYVVHNNEKIYCNMPDDTDVYVLGHTTTLHGVDDDHDRWIMFTHFEIDSIKHTDLLTRSIEKYSKHVIRS